MSRVNFNRSRIFNAHDHLYKLEARKNDKKEPFLLEIIEDLSNILEKAMTHLQQIYLKDKEHHIYISFSQQSSTIVGITTGKVIFIYIFPF